MPSDGNDGYYEILCLKNILKTSTIAPNYFYSIKMQEIVTFQALSGAEDKINETKVQFIPAKMELISSGKAPIHTYFDQYTEEVDGGKIFSVFYFQQL